MDEMTLTLNSPITEEQWDMIEDVDFDHTDSITFYTKHGKEVEFVKRKTGKWINNIHDIPICDQCGYMTPYDRAIDDYEYGNFCPNCGSYNGGDQS